MLGLKLIHVSKRGHWGLICIMSESIDACSQKLQEAINVTTEHIEAETSCHHFADDIFKCIFLNENVWISLQISLKFVRNVQINNITALIQIMAWHWPGNKPLSEPMMVSLLTHICITRPQWVKGKATNTIYLCQVHLAPKELYHVIWIYKLFLKFMSCFILFLFLSLICWGIC